MSAPDDTIPHLRPMDAAAVDPLCDAAHRLCRDSYMTMMEANALRASRTPWDARRLANALANYDPGHITPEIAEIIAELDQLALDKAGLKPGPRRHLGGK